MDNFLSPNCGSYSTSSATTTNLCFVEKSGVQVIKVTRGDAAGLSTKNTIAIALSDGVFGFWGGGIKLNIAPVFINVYNNRSFSVQRA